MTAISQASSSPVILQARTEPKPQAQAPVPTREGASPRLGAAAERLDVAGDGTDPRAAAEAVAKAFAGSKDIQVDSFHDEGTGRYVTRITDRWSGRVLVQTPPDELLRFIASGQELFGPRTMIDA